MAMADVKKFVKAVDTDTQLQAKMKLAGESYEGDPKDINRIVAENVLPFAKELGFEFTVEEYTGFLDGSKASETLDEDDLDMVVGGQGDTYYISVIAVYLPGVSPKE